MEKFGGKSMGKIDKVIGRNWMNMLDVSWKIERIYGKIYGKSIQK